MSTATDPATPKGAAAGLLDGIRVVEMCDFVAGPFAGKLLADLGASVIKIEPASGDSARRAGPFPQQTPSRESSALFLQHNTNKRSVRLDVTTRAGRRLLGSLIDDADVFLYDATPAEQARLGLTPNEIRDGRPALIIGSVTPNGLSGPAAEIASTPLTRAHSAGTAFTLFRGLGAQASRPIRTGAQVNEADGGLACATAVVAALIARGENGDGQLIEVSTQEAMMSMDRVDLSIGHNNPDMSIGNQPRFGGIVQCADGYAVVVTPQKHQWQGLVQAMGDPAWAFDESGEIKDHTKHATELQAEFATWAREHTRDELYHSGQAHGAPLGPVYTPSEVLQSEQERARGFFERIDHPVAGAFDYAGFGAIFGATPARKRRPAPLLGADGAAVLRPYLVDGWTAAQARRAGIA